MKYIILLQILFNLSVAALIDVKSFKADFKQVVTDDKGKQLLYDGHIQATNPKYALWQYMTPIEKSIYITPNKITIIEPEIEQVLIRNLSSDFDFFRMIKYAKKISENSYVTFLNDSKYTIRIKDDLIDSISYIDEFGNTVEITFKNQFQNIEISKEIFTPLIPKNYDIIDE